MENPLHLDFKPQEDISDTLSSSAASMGYYAFEENSPTQAHSTTSPGDENLSKCRKIRKKRDAYRKIDDETRLHLLEAVQRGETLKSAAKRYQVNYSSAKSIFHIYRKEGRILKKATQDKDFGIGPMAPESEAPPQFVPNPTQIPLRPFYQNSIFPQACQPMPLPLEFRQEHLIHNMNDGSGCSSPLNGLVDNFAELLKIGGASNKPMENKNFMPMNPSRFLPKMVSPTNSLSKMMQPNQQMSLSSKPPVMSPADRMKQFGDFYMNYSNSPLSGNARMTREGSESGSNRYVQNEFDSFSDMVSAFQNQKKTLKKLSGEEELGWNGNIENAALDTYKSFIDAQMILSNAFMKASYLNNLIQKSKMDASPSPKFLTFPGN